MPLLLLALLLAACDSSPSPILKTPTATATLASENLYVACGDGMIRVLRARNGEVMTTLYKMSGPSATAPMLSAGVLYYGEFSRNSNLVYTALVARDITTGRDLWRTATPTNVVEPPVVQQDTVYVVANDFRYNAVSTLLALDARSGAIRWRYESHDRFVGSPMVSEDTVWAATSSSLSADGSLLALRAHDGALLWRIPLAEGPSSSPVLAQGILYVGSTFGALHALHADTGANMWVYHTGLSTVRIPSVLDGVVYASDDETLFALNAADGRRLWSHSSITNHLGWGKILAQDRTIYAGAPDGLLYALDARTGATLRAYKLDDQTPITTAERAYVGWTAPLLRYGVLYIESTFSGLRIGATQVVPSEVVAIDLDTSAVRWTQTVPERACSPLVLG